MTGQDDQEHPEDERPEDEEPEAEELEEGDGGDGGPDDEEPEEDADTAAEAAPAAATPAPAPAAGGPAGFTYPFNIRYGAEVLDYLIGFAEGHTYSEADIKTLLIQNGFTEFQDMDPAFHHSAATNTVVITIKGSKKGDGHGHGA